MYHTPVQLTEMQPQHIPSVGRLLVHGFRGKFQPLTSLPDEILGIFFEKLLAQHTAASQRIVALHGDEVVGSLSLKQKISSSTKNTLQFPWIELRPIIGTRNLIKLFFALCCLDHQPRASECYIEDIAVHPDQQGRGIGKFLLDWAQSHVKTTPCLDVLSLHVAGKNPRAKKLYEQMSFRTHHRNSSFLQYLILGEPAWDYMLWPKP